MAANTKKNALDLFSGMNEVKKVEERPEPIKESVKEEQDIAIEIINSESKAPAQEKEEDKPFRINLSKREDRSKKSHTLYFDEDIYKKLERLAKNHGLSVSEALDEILKQVL